MGKREREKLGEGERESEREGAGGSGREEGREGGRERKKERKEYSYACEGTFSFARMTAHKFQRPFIVVESPTSSDTNSPHLSLPPPQLTEVVDSVQEELKAMDSYSSDVVCVNELWQRYTHKLELA